MSRITLRRVMLAITVLGIILTSYLVYVHYSGAKPICTASTGGPEDADIQERRAYAKWWVTQRGICELISYTSVAVFLAIVGAALTEDVNGDPTGPRSKRSRRPAPGRLSRDQLGIP